MDSYAELGAKMLIEKHKKPSLFSAYVHGFATFVKMYFIQFGFLDGKIGLILATNYAFADLLQISQSMGKLKSKEDLKSRFNKA